MNKNESGLSLFEVMLVMLVISMVVVAMITFKQQRTQETAAEQLGFRLYQYGLAVTDYARQNPDAFDPDNEPEPFYGYEWLQEIENPETNSPFLGESFTLDIHPLVIRDVEAGEGPLKTVFIVHETGLGAYELKVDLIEMGTVMKPMVAAKTEEGQQGTLYEPDIVLASNAAKYATEYRSRDGAANIAYYLSDNFLEDPKNAHILGMPKVDVGLSDYWLRIDGENYMQGPVRFNDVSIGGHRRYISGVDKISFSEEEETTGLIEGVDTIEFADEANTYSAVKGIRVVPPPQDTPFVAFRNSSGESLQPLVHEGVPMLPSNSVCFLASVTIPGSSVDTCTVRVGTTSTNPTMQWQIRIYRGGSSNNDVVCGARCIMFNWD